MFKKSLLLTLLMVLLVPLAMHAQETIPYNEGFENMSSADDLTAAGWTLSTTESGTFLAIETTASNVYEGSKSLNFDAWDASSSSSVQYLGLPLMDGDLSTLQISFAYKVSNGTVNVGYLTDETDFSTFVSLAQYSSSSSFTVKTTDLSEAPKDAVRLVIKYTGWYRCYLDSFEVTPAPTCEAATSITASDITATSATIAWEGEGDTWNLKYNGTVVNGIAAMTYNLTGLTDGTNYTVSVQNVCDDGTTTDWISTTFRTPEVCPENTVCIGEGTATNIYLPTYAYYKNSLTQQIYTADELGEAGAIESIAFYSVQANTKSRTFDFYMVATDKDAFSSTTDWIAVTSADLVGSATVTLKEGWNTFELDNPFVYDGSSNVALIIDATASEYENGITFYVYDAPSSDQAIRVYSDGTDYDPTAPSSYTGTLLSVKNRLRVVMGEPPACPKPTGLTVNYEGNTEATVTWTSEATSFNISVNGVVTEGVTSPYTLENLELSTEYEVMVQANCGGGELSEWTNPVSFTTDDCMLSEMTIVNYALTDSYGDGWNDNYIIIVDETCNIVDLLTIESGSSATGTLKVCGPYIQFLWYPGSYPDETSWVFTDADGNELFSGAGNADMAAYDELYVLDNNPVKVPTGITVDNIGPRSVDLSWTEQGTATTWQLMIDGDEDNLVTANSNPFTLSNLEPETDYYVQVRAVVNGQYSMWTCVGADFTTNVPCPTPSDLSVTPYPYSANVTWNGWSESYDLEWAEVVEYKPSQDATWLQYDNGTPTNNIGNSTVYTWEWGVMYPADSIPSDNIYLNRIAFYESSYFTNGHVVTISIYSGGDSAPETLISTEEVTCTASDTIRVINLLSPITIDPTQNLWITLTSTTLTYPMTMCAVNVANGRWVNNGGSWIDIGSQLSSVASCSFMIRGLIDNVTPEYDWNTVSDVESPYTINGLDSEIEYVVRVKSTCGVDGESGWTTTNFTTPAPCGAPVNLEATDITYDAANLSWTGYQESYNLRYRQPLPADPSTPATIIFEAHDVWQDGSGYQMLFDADAATYGVLWNENHYILVDSVQYSGGDLPTEYYDEFEYMIPAGANGALDDTINVVVDEIVTVTIPAGTYDYVILNPTPGDRFYIAADNGEVPCAADNYEFEPGVTYHFTMQKFGSGDGAAFEVIRDWSDWTTVENVTNPYAFTDLTPKTQYEWQVQGVNCSGSNNTEWSEIQTFTTENLPSATIDLLAGANWFSTNLEITLTELQDALVAAVPAGSGNIVIKAKTQTRTYNGTSWRGNLTWDVARMYVINVPVDCEIMLTGMPVNPSDHPVTIVPGTNWIAFPLNETMQPADAFAGFSVKDDVVKSKTGSTKRLANGNWRGTNFPGLEPWKGYYYNSAATTNRTLTFPASSSKAAPKTVATPKKIQKERLIMRKSNINTTDFQPTNK